MASFAQPGILFNTQMKCTDCDKKFKTSNYSKVCSDCSAKRVQERKVIQSTSPTRVPGQLFHSGKSKQTSRYHPLYNVRMDQPSSKVPSGLKVKRSADYFNDGTSKTSSTKAPRLNLSDSDTMSKGVAAYKEYEKNQSHSVPCSPTKLEGGSSLSANEILKTGCTSTEPNISGSISKDLEKNKDFVMIDLTKESDKSEDEMPIYTVVVKAENIEEHADTTPPSLNIYPVGINLENPHDNSKHKEIAKEMDVTNSTSISEMIGESNLSNTPDVVDNQNNLNAVDSGQSSIDLNLGSSGGTLRRTLNMDSNSSTVRHQPRNFIEKNCVSGLVEVENSAISEETQHNVDRSQTVFSLAQSLAEPSIESVLNGSKDSGILDTSENNTNVRDTPVSVTSAEKPDIDGPTEEAHSLVMRKLKEFDVLDLEQLKSQEEEWLKELLLRYPEDVFSAEIEREQDRLNQHSLKMGEENALLSSKKASVTTKKENVLSLLFFLTTCQEECDSLAAKLKEIGDSAAQLEKLNKELQEAQDKMSFSKSLIASTQSDLSEVVKSCTEVIQKKINRITEELNNLISFRQTEQSTKSELANAKVNLKVIARKYQNAYECQKEEENQCTALADSCTKIGFQIEECLKRISELRKNHQEMSSLQEIILTSKYLREMKEIAKKRDYLLK